MAGDNNRGLQYIRFDKNNHQITLGETNERIPVRGFFEYLRQQGVEERPIRARLCLYW